MPQNKCNLCELGQHATQMVRGEGNPNARIMLVGEAPGREEDIRGRPFVGDAGKLLDKILAKANIERSSLYITNACKCRPPQNRPPTILEIQTCMSYLKEDIKLVSPLVIIPLGRTATTAMSLLYGFDMKERFTSMVGQMIIVSAASGYRYIIPAFHPAFFLRNHEVKYEHMMFECFLKAKSLVDAMSNDVVRYALELFEGRVVNVSVSLSQVKNNEGGRI